MVRGVLSPRRVSSAYLLRDARFSRRGVPCGAVLAFAAALQWNAHAAPPGVADRARALIAELEADAAARELVQPTVGRAKQALSRAESAPAAHAAPLEDTALEWAEVARDLVRASAAERASDALEQEASALATEIARLRAAVEHAMARVGRARQDLKALEGGAPPAGALPAGTVPVQPGPKPAAPPRESPKPAAPGAAPRSENR